MDNVTKIRQEPHRFSWIIGHSSRTSKPHYDQILWETKSYVVLPSLGSLVPGWMLIVPKRQMENFSQLDDKEVTELRGLLPEVARSAQQFPGNPYVFEHGSTRGSSMACGVDQAHLHVVPLEIDLCETAIEDNQVAWNIVSSPFSLFGRPSNGEYLFVSDLSNRSYRGLLQSSVSQWFRQHIATHIGKRKEWDYREFPCFDNMRRTFDVLGSSNVSRQQAVQES